MTWLVLSEALHDDEILIEVDLVWELVDSQFPAYGDKPVVSLRASGSSNKFFYVAGGE